MPRETISPFEDPTQRETDDASLVGQVLGPNQEADMRRLLDGETPAESGPATEDLGELTLSDTDREAIEHAETATPEQRKEQFVQWAESIGRDDVWVERNFMFNDDGTVETWGRLDIDSKEFTGFPPGLVKIRDLLHISPTDSLKSCNTFPKEINGGVYIGGCGIESLEGLPPVINGDLEVLNNELTDLKGLPKTINGNFILRGNSEISSLEGLRGLTVGGHMNLCFMWKVFTIPEGIDVKEKIIFDSEQTELIADAREKGYTVEIYR